MDNTNLLIGTSILSFSLASFASYLLTKWFIERSRPRLAPNARVRIVFRSGVVRATYVTNSNGAMVFAGLSVHGAVKVPEVGDSVAVQSARSGPNFLFRATVMEVESDPLRIVLTEPVRILERNRRTGNRQRPATSLAVMDGRPCIVEDLSPEGAKVSNRIEKEEGEQVSFGFGNKRVVAWVVGITPDGEGRQVQRLRFEHPVEFF